MLAGQGVKPGQAWKLVKCTTPWQWIKTPEEFTRYPPSNEHERKSPFVVEDGLSSGHVHFHDCFREGSAGTLYCYSRRVVLNGFRFRSVNVPIEGQ